MSLENIDSENPQLNGFESIDFEENFASTWNGRSVIGIQIDQGMNALRDAVLPSLSNKMQLLSTSLPEAEIITCGEKVDGEVSVRGSTDSEGNKNAEVEVEVSSKDGNISGSVSGSINQDKDERAQGKVEVEFTYKF